MLTHVITLLSANTIYLQPTPESRGVDGSSLYPINENSQLLINYTIQNEGETISICKNSGPLNDVLHRNYL